MPRSCTHSTTPPRTSRWRSRSRAPPPELAPSSRTSSPAPPPSPNLTGSPHNHLYPHCPGSALPNLWASVPARLGPRTSSPRPQPWPPWPLPVRPSFQTLLCTPPNLGRPGSPGWALAVRQVDLRRDGQDAHDRAGRHQGSAARSKCLLGSARARRLRLLRGRLAALGGSALPGSGRPTGRPATASGARASHLQSRPFSTPLTIQEEAETAAKAYREAMDDD